MERKEFLDRERNAAPEKYDLTDEEDCVKEAHADAYRGMTGYEKFFAYKNEDMSRDPDTRSRLLREIYAGLWRKEILEYCPCSDTITSVAYSLNKYVALNCSESIARYKLEHGKPRQRVSVRLCGLLYADDPAVRQLFLRNKDLLAFVSAYHTIGNYIPVPEKFNANRSGKFADHDFWDLTLMQIKQYYDLRDSGEPKSRRESPLYRMLGNSCSVEHCVKWLDCYGSWEEFVYFNYLWDYIDTDTPEHPVKPFCPGHDWTHNEISDFDAFLGNVAQVIAKRGRFLVQMLELSARLGAEAYESILTKVFEESEKKDWKNSEEIAEAVMRA